MHSDFESRSKPAIVLLGVFVEDLMVLSNEIVQGGGSEAVVWPGSARAALSGISPKTILAITLSDNVEDLSALLKKALELEAHLLIVSSDQVALTQEIMASGVNMDEALSSAGQILSLILEAAKQANGRAIMISHEDIYERKSDIVRHIFHLWPELIARPI